MANAKIVSKNYAINEFSFTGLVLILYSIFSLYIPFVLSMLLEELNMVTYKGYNLEFLGTLLCLILGTLIPFLLLRIFCKKSNKEFIGKANIKLSQLLIDFVVFFVLSLGAIYVTTILAVVLGIESGIVSSIGITFNTELIRDPIYLIAFLIITPILEEYAFRGVLLNCLSRYGKYFAVIATSVIYAFAHGSFIEMVPSFIMCIVLCKISLKYKSIRPTIVIHILFNGMLAILGSMSESMMLYEEIILGAFLLLALFFLFSRRYHIIHVKKSNTNNKVGILFLSTPTVIVALVLFIANTLLTMFI